MKPQNTILKATLALAFLALAQAATNGQVLTGIDVLQSEGFRILQGKRIGLITNHTGINRKGETTIDLLYNAPGVKLVALFSPEHGISGQAAAGQKVPSLIHQRLKIPIHSLYGETLRPTPEMLQGIDVLVFDIQDIGARFYTYISTMGYSMEEAAKHKIKFVVLDRPNPINGIAVEGPIQDADRLSFTAYFPMPIRHGMTVGELARMFNEEKKLGLDLEVVKLRGWRRQMWFDETGLPWVNPSPNVSNLYEAMLYPGTCLLEGTNVVVKNIEFPFERFGAPWIDGVKLSEKLNAKRLPGVAFYPVTFIPSGGQYANRPCNGVYVLVTDRQKLEAVTVGIEIVKTLYEEYGDKFEVDKVFRLLAARAVIEQIKAKKPTAEIVASFRQDVAKFMKLRRKYLLYQD